MLLRLRSLYNLLPVTFTFPLSVTVPLLFICTPPLTFPVLPVTVPPAAFHPVNGSDPDPEHACEVLGKEIAACPIDVAFVGIGENGHIAFNNPPVADFADKRIIKPVQLDEICRNQQVNDGCFARLEDVPKTALTLTIPTLFNADYLFCSVPAATKADAVYHTVTDAEISTKCPATIMRRHPHAVLYCDKDSAAKIL